LKTFSKNSLYYFPQQEILLIQTAGGDGCGSRGTV